MSSLVGKITDTGRAMMAAANNGATLTLDTFGIDDGNGAAYTPTGQETALVNTVHSGNITNVYQKADDPTTLVVEVRMGVDIGPFWMRAVGLYAATGELVAVVGTPEMEIVPASLGFATETLLNIFIPHAGNANITLTIDASQVCATKSYVNNQVAAIDIPQVPTASETVVGKVELADVAETIAGLLDTKAVHPAGLAAALAKWLASGDLSTKLTTLNNAISAAQSTANAAQTSATSAQTTATNASNLANSKSQVAITMGTGAVIYPAGYMPAQCSVLYTKWWNTLYTWQEKSAGTNSIQTYPQSMLGVARGDVNPLPQGVQKNAFISYPNEWLVIGVK